MGDNWSTRQGARLAVTSAIVMLVLVTIAFAVAFAAASKSDTAPSPGISAQTYAIEVAAALDGATAAEGAVLIEAFQGNVCHVSGEGRIAPSFIDIGERAATRRPPLSAAQYLYESIVAPGAYLVEGYANAMPANFADRLSRAEIGRVSAYLLAGDGGWVR